MIIIAKELKRLREDYEEVRADLATMVGEFYPLGARCAIVRTRNDKKYQITGFIRHLPIFGDPTRLSVQTDARGTILNADYEDIELL